MIKSLMLAALLFMPLTSFANASLDDTAWKLRFMKCEDKGADINPTGLTWEFYFNKGNVFKQTFTVQRPDFEHGRKCVAKSTGLYQVTDDRVLLDLEAMDAGHTECGLGNQDLAPYYWNLKSIDATKLILTRVQDGQECSNAADIVYATFDVIAQQPIPPVTTPPPLTPGPPPPSTVKPPSLLPTLEDIVLAADGTPRRMNQAAAIQYCADRGKRLPTIRELADIAVTRGSEVSEVPEHNFYGVDELQPDGSTKTFYYNPFLFEPTGDEWIWSSSRSNQPSGVLRGYSLELRRGLIQRLVLTGAEGGSHLGVQCVR